MQTPLPLGNRQRIIGQGEMVHAHVHITRAHQHLQCMRQHRHLGAAVGQLVHVDAALRLEALGQMRVGVQGNAVRPQPYHLLQCALHRRQTLPGQAVNQIDVDRLQPPRPRRVHQVKHLLGGLDAVHRCLHIRVKVLHAKAQAVKAQIGQGLQPRHAHRARVDFNRDFGFGGQAEVGAQQRHQLGQFVVAQKRGAAAAQVQLPETLARAHDGGVQRQFFGQVVQVARRAAVVFGDDLVAGAVVAQRLAKRNVHIQRQRGKPPRCAQRLLQNPAVVRVVKGLDKTVYRWVRGVARPGNVKAAQEFRRGGGCAARQRGNGRGHGCSGKKRCAPMWHPSALAGLTLVKQWTL